MAIVSKHCRISTPISSTLTPRACTRSSGLLCRAALQPEPKHATRRESLGFLLALPLLVSTQTAQAVDLGDFRRAKGVVCRMKRHRSPAYCDVPVSYCRSCHWLCVAPLARVIVIRRAASFELRITSLRTPQKLLPGCRRAGQS